MYPNSTACYRKDSHIKPNAHRTNTYLVLALIIEKTCHYCECLQCPDPQCVLMNFQGLKIHWASSSWIPNPKIMKCLGGAIAKAAWEHSDTLADDFWAPPISINSSSLQVELTHFLTFSPTLSRLGNLAMISAQRAVIQPRRGTVNKKVQHKLSFSKYCPRRRNAWYPTHRISS